MRMALTVRITLLALVLLASFTNYSLADDAASQKLSSDNVEFHELLGSIQKDVTVAQTYNWRELYLAVARRWEEFIAKYPDSTYNPEAKLLLASYYKDVEKPEVYELKIKEAKCWNEAKTRELQDSCLKKFQQKLNALGSWVDPIYRDKAARLALEVLQTHGAKRRPSKTDADLGALALLLLGDIFPNRRIEYYRQIISQKYRLGEVLQKDIAEFIQGKETKDKGN